MLDIKNLTATVGDKQILRGIDLTVNAGEVHAIMGPNGSGKSTLARALSGHPEYQVTGGEVLFEGKDLLDLEPEERVCSHPSPTTHHPQPRFTPPIPRV